MFLFFIMCLFVYVCVCACHLESFSSFVVKHLQNLGSYDWSLVSEILKSCLHWKIINGQITQLLSSCDTHQLLFYLTRILALYLASIWHFCGILFCTLSVIYSDILSGILNLSAVYSDILSGILNLSAVYSDILSGILCGNSIWHLPVQVRQWLLTSGARGWGPAVPANIWSSRLWSLRFRWRRRRWRRWRTSAEEGDKT